MAYIREKFMFLFKRNKYKDKKKTKLDWARHLDGRFIRYTTERIGHEEIVLGKEGSISVRDGELIVLSSQNIVFRANIDELQMSELLNLSGAVLVGPDLEHDRKHRTVIAYYVNY